MFAISPESTVCDVLDDTDAYILILYVAKHCHGNLHFRLGTHSLKEGIMYHHIKPLAIQLSNEICNISPVFHDLTGCDYANSFYRRSKNQIVKKMCLKPELTALFQPIKIPNPNFLKVTDFVLHVICKIKKNNSDDDRVSVVEFNDDSDTEWTLLKFIFIVVQL